MATSDLSTSDAAAVLVLKASSAAASSAAGEGGEEEEQGAGQEEEDPLETTMDLLYSAVSPPPPLSPPPPPPLPQAAPAAPAAPGTAATAVTAAPRAWGAWGIGTLPAAGQEEQGVARMTRSNSAREQWTRRGRAAEGIRANWSNTLSGPLRRPSEIVGERRRMSMTTHHPGYAKAAGNASTLRPRNESARSTRAQPRRAAKPPSRAKTLDARRVLKLRQNFGHDALEATVDMLYDIHPNKNSTAPLALSPPDARLSEGRTIRRVVCMDSASVAEFVASTAASLGDDEASRISHFALIKDHGAPGDRRIGMAPLLPFLARLRGLHTLVLRRLNFTDLPAELDVLAPTLTTIDAAHNSLRQWPAVLTAMTKLQILDLSHNNLDVPPEFTCGPLCALRVFKLSANRLMRCPSEIETFLYQTLEELYLDRNSLTAIPATVGTKFEHLHVFTCFGNPFATEQDRRLSKAGLPAIRRACQARQATLRRESFVMQQQQSHQKKPKRRSVNKIKNAPVVGGGGLQAYGLDEFRTTARIKRGKLTRTWDLRPYAHVASLPNVFFSNVAGIQEALVHIAQLPFLVQDESPTAQIELSSSWRLVFGMKELVVLWVFPNDVSDAPTQAAELSAISRQLSLVFNIANEGPASRRGEQAWRFTLYRRGPSASTTSDSK
jgi:hypothetical protein